jgi:hypothetical protein
MILFFIKANCAIFSKHVNHLENPEESEAVFSHNNKGVFN